MPEIDLSRRRRIHVIGVAGPGMSALAIVLAQMGNDVSGSDLRELEVLQRVRSAGVSVTIGHSKSAVNGVDYVVASSAIPESNIEWSESKTKGIHRVRRAQMLAAVCAQTGAIAVAGTHGKTTSSAMLTRVLLAAGKDPAFLIGGDVLSLEPGSMSDELTSARWADSGLMIVEADESDGTHAVLPIESCLVTNIDTDHLDHFGDFGSIVTSFNQFVSGAHKHRVVNSDDVNLADIARRHSCITFGFEGDPHYRGSKLSLGGGSLSFVITHAGVDTQISIPMIGRHNAMNALGVFAMASELGIDDVTIATALSTYRGVIRRCEYRAEFNGAKLYDDYAHLPAEIYATLNAFRTDNSVSGKLIAVFQPNRFNRMSVISPEYADAFIPADKIYVNNVYASGTTPIEGVTGQLVVDAILAKHPNADVVYIEDRSELVEAVRTQLQPGDVCVSMGCGDIEFFPDQVVASGNSA